MGPPFSCLAHESSSLCSFQGTRERDSGRGPACGSEDRNAGAEAVGSLNQLQGVLRDNDRVWILINKEKFRTRGKNIRWEYPAARIEDFLRKNAEVKYRSPFWYVYLWDASAGNYRTFRGE